MTRFPERGRRPVVRSTMWVLAATVVSAPLVLLAPDSMLGAVAVATGGCCAFLLWRPGESPIFLFIVGYHWLQVNAKTIYGLLTGIEVTAQQGFGGDVVTAIVLGNVAVLALALGLRAGAGPWRSDVLAAAREQAVTIPIRVWLQVYALAWLVSFGAAAVAWAVPGLTQLLLALSGLRWAAFFALTYAAFTRKSYWRPWWLVFGAEYVLALGGFFAGFATAIFYALFALVAVSYPFRWSRIAPLISLIVLLSVSALVWTAVKGEYRGYVSGGVRAQVVAVDRGDRLQTLAQMAVSLSPEALIDNIDTLVERFAYVDIFAVVLNVVPEQKPHAGGELWGDALVRPFMPRLLFPGKSVVNDSTLTNEYTGLGFATHEQGTSVSMGYVAEAYIDFGMPLMFLPILVLGWLMGRYYRWMQSDPRSRGVWAMALSSLALYPAMYYETSITKMLPALAVSMLSMWVVVRFALPALLPWLLSRHFRRFAANAPTPTRY